MKISFLFLSAIIGFLFSSTQTASNLCIAELKNGWGQTDPGLLAQSEDLRKLDFVYSYMHRENSEVVKEKVNVTAGRGQIRRLGSDKSIVTDGQSTFTWFPQRYVVYRTTPRAREGEFIENINPGVFDFGQVTECEFIPGIDTSKYKRMLFEVNAEGRQKYGIDSVEIVTGPKDSSLVRLWISFTPEKEIVWSKYEFRHIALLVLPEEEYPSPEKFFLDETGKLKPEFKGAAYYDYRK